MMDKSAEIQVTHGNLFSGSGTWELAAQICGIKTLWEAEIEPFPVKVEAARFPDAIQLGDVSKISGADIPVVDIMTNSSPCFAAGTMIRTSFGMKPIEEIKVGDSVLTHTGQFHAVTDCGCTGAKETVRLKAMGICDIVATPNHPFYVRHMTRHYPSFHMDGKLKRGNERVFGKPEWKPLGELSKKDYIGIPISTAAESSKLTEEELWLAGRYIADGYRRHDQPTVCFCIGKGKLEEFKSKLNEYHGYMDVGRTATKYCITNQRLYSICGTCGDGAINKRFPTWFEHFKPEELKIVLDGYLSGDGCAHRNGYKATTISRTLALDIVYAASKTYKRPCQLHFAKRPSKCVIEGRTVNQHDTYQVIFGAEKRKQDKAFYEDGYIWLPIREITAEGVQDVYNLTVDVDNSYTVNNIAVHNCQDLSIAGKRAGLDGERSGLFDQAIRICKEMRDAQRKLYGGRSDELIRPRFWCWENVPGAFSSNKGEDFRIVLESVARMVQADAIIPLPPKGWSYAGVVDLENGQIAWRVLDAQYELPQRRRRIFLVADLAGHSAAEVLFEREGLSWDFKEIAETWKDTSQSLGERISEASRIVLGGVRGEEVGVGSGVEKKNG